MRHCGIVILAAGGSSRLGFPKQLVTVDGVTLLRRIVNEAIASVCKPVVVVLGSQADKMRSELEGLPITIAVNDRWQAGMGSSIRCGVATLLSIDSTASAILIAVCDQPRITRAVFDCLTAAQSASQKSICAAEYSNTLGTPAVFSSMLFPELLGLADAAGGRVVIDRHLSNLERIAIPEAELDLDTPDDLNRFERSK